MSMPKVRQIKHKLLSMFEQHLNLSDITTGDTDRELKVLSRCLAAFAVYLEAGCSEKDAAASVWDGSDDNGIDAAYYDQSDSRVILVQSKWIQKGTGEPEAKEIGTFIAGISDIIEQNHTMFHSRLKDMLSDISLQMATPGTKVHVVLATTGTNILAKHGQQLLGKFQSALNGNDSDPLVTVEVKGLNDIYDGLSHDAVYVSISLEATIYDWSHVTMPYVAYFGIIDGLQLKTWWLKYGKRVVAANIRHSFEAVSILVMLPLVLAAADSHR